MLICHILNNKPAVRAALQEDREKLRVVENQPLYALKMVLNLGPRLFRPVLMEVEAEKSKEDYLEYFLEDSLSMIRRSRNIPRALVCAEFMSGKYTCLVFHSLTELSVRD